MKRKTLTFDLEKYLMKIDTNEIKESLFVYICDVNLSKRVVKVGSTKVTVSSKNLFFLADTSTLDQE